MKYIGVKIMKMLFVTLLALCASSYGLVERELNTELALLLSRTARSSPTCNKKAKISNSDAEEFVNVHNEYRLQTHGSDMKELEWDDDLAKVTQELVERCEWKHDLLEDCSGKRAGQNLYVSFTTGGSISLNPRKAVKAWYDEISDYEYSTMRCSAVCGHYTQVVWAKSGKVGCASHECKKVKGVDFGMEGKYLLVACNYYPAGNWKGEHPYEKGQDCSHCPDGTHCHEGLCASKKR